jgi:hypothetical protein
MPDLARLITLPFCRVVTFGAWNESPRRRFAAYRCRAGSPRLLGHAVVDEFATLSSPVFLCPRPLAGKIYDAGISLAHRRDAEMDIDQGWPPLVLGVDQPAPGFTSKLEADWQQRLLEALQAPGDGEKPGRSDGFVGRDAGQDRLEWARVATADVLVTSAPLLPKQLARLCETSPLPFAVAVSTAEVLVRSPDGRPRSVAVASEGRLQGLLSASKALLPGRG